MNSVTPTGMMIDALNDEFKARGIHYRTVAERLARQLVSTLNLRDSACSWLFYQARLSPGSEAVWRDMMKRFDAELRTLGMTESDRPPHKGQWYRFFLGARTLTARQLLE